MRCTTIWLLLAVSCLTLTPARAATNSWCFYFFAVDVVECRDERLTALREKIYKTYNEALAELKGADQHLSGD